MFSWVIPGKIAGSHKPRSLEEINDWINQGIKAVVVLEERHRRIIDVDALSKYFDVLETPIKDFNTLTINEINTITKWIDEKIKGNKSVVVHCGTGLERTGVIIASYLVSVGWRPEDAINYVRRKRPGSIETEDQEKVVYNYYKALRNNKAN
jgi:atypical dual specificity phosphatase